MMPKVVRATSALLFVAGCHHAAKPGAPFESLKDCNIVFVSFDALQASHVGCLGSPRNTTPTLDALAKQGSLFTHAHSVASWTVPASMT